ncbi:MAG TPA: hypothetical protein VM716_11200 [Gemmatimonadales bacterium]|nr:hypothetical protein [Gemmatimonadales bacterium]
MPRPLGGRSRLAILGPAAACTAFLVTACDNTSSGPRSVLPVQFSHEVSLPDLHNQLVTGTARVAVSVIPGTLTARRVEIEGPDQVNKPERVRSRVTAITPGTDMATLTLELGGLKIAVNGSTKLHPDDGDGDGMHEPMPAMSDDGGTSMTLADFVARVQADLAAGKSPAVRATRQPAAKPQAPDDGSFLAATLQLDEGNNHPLVQLNITAANLTTNATPPPDAILKVLGVSLEIRTSDGTTKLESDNETAEGAEEFHGVVKSVDQTAQTVTLMDGTIIHIVAGTEFEAREGDEDDHLTTLADVQAALTAGKTVEAEGRGLVTSTSPLTLDAIRIEFEVEGEELPPAVHMEEFSGEVASVDVAGGTFTLAGGTGVVTVTSETHISADGAYHTLQGVSDALTAKKTVRAEGVGSITAAGPPPAIKALFVKFETPMTPTP